MNKRELLNLKRSILESYERDAAEIRIAARKNPEDLTDYEKDLLEDLRRVYGSINSESDINSRIKNINAKDVEKLRLAHTRDLASDDEHDLMKKHGPIVNYPSIDMPWLKHYTYDQIMVDVPEVTIYDYLYTQNKDRLDYTAINFYDKKVSYRELFENIDKAEKSLTKLGVKRGDCVTFCVPTIPETIYLFYALNKIGATGNFVDLRTNKERILKYINMTKSNVVVSFHGVLDKVKDVLPESTASKIIDIDVTDSLPFAKKVLYKLKVKDQYSGEYDGSIIKWSDFIKMGRGVKVKPLGICEDFPVAIVYTGGTTGEPKGAVLSNKSINTPVVQYAKDDIPRGENDTFVNIMPPFIAYGLVDGIHLSLTLGMEDLLMPKFDAKEFSQILDKYEPEHFIGIPSHFDLLMKDKRMEGKDLSFIKNAGCGGDTVPEALEIKVNEFLKEHNAENTMRVGYGLTENAAMSIFDLNNEVTKPGSIGIPLQHYNIGVFDDEGNEVPFGETGELCIKSDAAIMEYYDQPVETENIFVDVNGEKWVKTGDYARIDRDGHTYLMGRKRNMFTRPDGHNVFPDMISNKLVACPLIHEVCVVGIDSIYNEHGKIPTAIVVLNDSNIDEEIAKKEILEFQGTLLGDRDGAVEVRFRSELPRTPIGKIDITKIEREENLNPSTMDFDTLIANKKPTK